MMIRKRPTGATALSGCGWRSAPRGTRAEGSVVGSSLRTAPKGREYNAGTSRAAVLQAPGPMIRLGSCYHWQAAAVCQPLQRRGKLRLGRAVLGARLFPLDLLRIHRCGRCLCETFSCRSGTWRLGGGSGAATLEEGCIPPVVGACQLDKNITAQAQVARRSSLVPAGQGSACAQEAESPACTFALPD